MKIYVDSQNRCHPTNLDGSFREVETDFFNGKCQEFVLGYCYHELDGCIQIYPWKDYSELDAAQREYEREQLADMKAALELLEVRLNG